METFISSIWKLRSKRFGEDCQMGRHWAWYSDVLDGMNMEHRDITNHPAFKPGNFIGRITFDENGLGHMDETLTKSFGTDPKKASNKYTIMFFVDDNGIGYFAKGDMKNVRFVETD